MQFSSSGTIFLSVALSDRFWHQLWVKALKGSNSSIKELKKYFLVKALYLFRDHEDFIKILAGIKLFIEINLRTS